MPAWVALPGRASRRYRRAMQPSPDRTLPTAADVDAAAQRLAGVALRTPMLTSPVLDALTGARVFLKAETLQRTGSFKFRGAYNKLSSLPPAERAGGGLTAGIALAVKARMPQARLYTAEPEGFDDHARSFKSGRREKNAALTGTICDALMAQTPGEMTFAINRALVGAGAAVSDEEVAAAVAFAFRELKLVVEPGGAAALAALISGKIDVKGKIAVAVLSGGNVDPDLFYRLVA